MTVVDEGVSLSVDENRRYVLGFWAVAFAFLIVMASATLPSPLYGLYRVRDHLSAFMVTVIYAIYAGGTIAALVSVPRIAPRLGRRGVMIAAVVTMMAATALLAAWKALPGLLIGRFVTGVAVGLVAGTAITYLIELRLRGNANASLVRARGVATSISVGSLGLGPLLAGCLAQWAPNPLTLSYLILIGLGAPALVGLTLSPETAIPAARSGMVIKAAATARSSRILIPAATATAAAFAAQGLFAGLSGLFLATTLHHPSHALSGATLCLVFSSGVASQLGMTRLGASRVLATGTVSMLAGLGLLVISVRLRSPSLTLFLVGGALIGGGAGAVFKGATGLVLNATPPERRLAMTSDLLIALFLGLSVPVIGAGVALDRGVSAPATVLVFAILVGLAVAGAGAELLARAPNDRAPDIAGVRSHPSANRAGRGRPPDV